MLIENDFAVAAPPDEVYRTMVDVERVAPCIPGAEVAGVRDDGGYDAQVTVKIGPVTMAYRGWVAIDPKGVIGELEYELGAALRNPIGSSRIFEVERRIAQFAARLPIDAERTKAWALSQAVLATIWLIEDGAPVNPDHPWLRMWRTH